MELPDGIRVGHWSDFEGYTGCTVVLAPEGTVAAGEVRGGGDVGGDGRDAEVFDFHRARREAVNDVAIPRRRARLNGAAHTG